MRKLVSDAQNERKIADSMFAKLAKHCVRELETCFFTFCKLGLHLQCLCACNIYVFETCAMLCSATHAQLLVCATSVRLM